MSSLQQPRYYSRPEADTLVLFIHGIVEGPDQFIPLMELVFSHGLDAASLLLPGHGGSGHDFAHSSGEEWLDHVRSQVSGYKDKYSSLFLVGHSMGGLLSLLVAQELPHKIRGVACIDTPLAVWVKASAIRNNLKVGLSRNIPPSDPAYALWQACSVSPSAPLAYLTWIPRIMDLFSLIRRTREILPKLTVPVLVFHADKDELVGTASVVRFERGFRPEWLRLVHLPSSTHFVYGGTDEDTLRTNLMQFLELLK